MPIPEELIDRVLKSPKLPSIPAVALKIIDLVQQDEVNIDAIAETIRQDPALSSKLLKAVNSSFYGQSKTVSSINQALVVLGLNSVKTMALGFSLVSGLSEAVGQGFDHLMFWRRALFSATAAKQVCEHAFIVQAEEVFMASLLQDIGMLAMYHAIGSQYTHLMGLAKDDHSQLARHEEASLGGDHAAIGGALADHWGLPPVLAEPIRYHESPEDAPENIRPLVRAIVAGNRAAAVLSDPENDEKVALYRECMQRWFNIDQAQALPFLEELHGQAGEVKKLLELPAGDLGNPETILRMAHEAMERISLDVSKQADELARDNAELKEAVHTDPLTGVWNRRKFDADAADAFARAGADAPLTVMFLDIDHFKRFNDTHGHAAGDAVLKRFAVTLTGSADGVGELYRVGGEEFAMLFAGLDRKAAALLGEQLREAVDRETAYEDEGGGRHNVTMSVGVATYAGASYRRVEQLIRAADRGVYAAKHAGRNCVRVFVPQAESKADAA